MKESARLTLARTYAVLGNLYLRQPVQGELDALRKEVRESASRLRLLAESRSWTRLADASRALEASVSGRLDATTLAREHTRLFRAVKPGYGPPPPYESVQRGATQVMDAHSAEIEGRYAASGLVLSAEFRGEPPDHLGFELFFISHLFRLEAERLVAGDGKGVVMAAQERKTFIAQHPREWVGAYIKTLQRESREPLYAKAASVTGELLLLEPEQTDA